MMIRIPAIPRLIFESLLAVALAALAIRLALPRLFPNIADETLLTWQLGSLLVLVGPVLVWRLHHATSHITVECLQRRRQIAWRLTILVTAVMLTGLTFTIWAANRAAAGVQHEARVQFDRLTERLNGEAQRRMTQPLVGLKGARGVFCASVSVKRDEFRTYVLSQNLPLEFPGVRGLGFIQRVMRTDLAAFVAAARADNAPDFSIKTNPIDPAMGGESPELYIVKFIEPRDPNREAWGFDIGSEPLRRATAEQAMRTGELTLTPCIQIPHGDGRQSGLLCMLAIYRNGSTTTTPQERERALVGFVYAPIILEDAFAGLADVAYGGLTFAVYESNGPSNSTLVYEQGADAIRATGIGDKRSSPLSILSSQSQITVGARSWTIVTRSTPQFEAGIDRSTPTMIACGGLVFSVLIAGIVCSLGLSELRATTIARSMTSDVRAGEARLRAIFDAEPECVKILDAQVRVLDMNPAGLRLIEADSIERIRGISTLELIAPEHRDRYIADITRVIAGERVESTFEIVGLNGNRRWMEQTAVALADAAGPGSGCGILAIARDITQRRAEELHLTQSERRFRTLVEGTDVIVWEYDVGVDAFTYVSPQAAQLGYPMDRWYSRGFWQSTIHPDDRDTAVAYCAAKKLQGQNYRFQYRMLTSDGRIVWIDDFVTVESHDTDGVGTKLRGVLLDITAQKNAEARTQSMLELTSRLAKSDQVADAANAVLDTLERDFQNQARPQNHDVSLRSAVLVYGFDGVCRFVASRGLSAEYRKAVEGHCPWTEGALDALPIVLNDVMVDATLASYRELFARECIGALAFIPLQTERGVVGKVMVYASKAHAILPDQIEAARNVVECAGMSIGRIMATRRLERSEREAQGLRLAAEAASRTKSEFLANMSHEIRTPLTAILGFAELLREDGDITIAPATRLQTIDTINTAGVHLLTVINDILDLSKIEADKMTVERIDTRLVGIIREVEYLMQSRANGKGVTLTASLATPVPERIFSDPTRLRQILMNLVGNAVKFTDAGTVTMIASVRHTDGQRRLAIDVEDTGVGMTEQQSQRLFSAFAQADTTVTRKHGGTGLGLTISSRLAALMGGTVTLARTRPGKGSCFQVDLPLEPVPGSALIEHLDKLPECGNSQKFASDLSRLRGRILLAEDGIDNQRLISYHLNKAGATVDIAENGRVALAMIDRAERAGRPYDLLLTDMQMPEMDGYTLARTLRQRGSTLAIVALTAHAMAEDRARCTDAGCNDYATKPIDKATLLAICAAWVGNAHASNDRAAA